MFTTRSTARTEPVIDLVGDREALILCAHGSRRKTGDLARRARRLAARSAYAAVASCALFAAPKLEEAVAQVTGERVVLVPFLMAEGYTYDALRRRAAGIDDPRPILLGQPVGTHPAMAQGIADSARCRCRVLDWQVGESALLLVGHGTPRHPGSREAVQTLAASLARLGLFAETATAFLEEDPGIETALAGLRSRTVIAVGFFAEAGDHGAADLPRLLAASARELAYLGPIGEASWIDDIVFSRAAAADRSTAA
jgi:sirohydrochlorin cobaltochelatase